MHRLHITQDDHGFWMLSLEGEDGSLTLLAHQFAEPDHLLEKARELNASGRLTATIVVDPPRPPAIAAAARAAAPEYTRPAPRKAGA